jgi:xanthine dehydrogenase YagT iron-sulfur-binding subunit
MKPIAGGDAAVTSAEAPPVETARGAFAITGVMVNGISRRLPDDARVTLVDFLREGLGLTGTKVGCDHGQCGACTVLANGRRINSCLTLAIAHAGDEITTVEGLAPADGPLHPVQSAFVEHDAFQCGFCTPGQLCAAVALLEEAAAGDPSAATPEIRTIGQISLTDEEIRERMSGNLCRCGAYPNIVAAVRAAGRSRRR